MLAQAYRLLENVSTAMSGLILLILVVIGIADVIAPMIGRPLSFVTELSQVGLAACIFLALPRVQSSISNISIDIVTERLSPTRLNIAIRAQYLLVALSLAALGWVMFMAAADSYATAEYSPGGAQITLWPFKACAAFGVTLASLGAFSVVLRRRAWG